MTHTEKPHPNGLLLTLDMMKSKEDNVDQT